MRQKTYEQLQKDNKRLKFIIVFLVFVFSVSILFIGTMNINTTQTAKHYENQVAIEKAKAKVFKDELLDLKGSGTCLGRIAILEERTDDNK